MRMKSVKDEKCWEKTMLSMAQFNPCSSSSSPSFPSSPTAIMYKWGCPLEQIKNKNKLYIPSSPSSLTFRRQPS
jgi:hypothetical protein